MTTIGFSTDTEVREDRRTVPTDEGDHERFSHYVEKDKLTPVSRSHAGLYSKGLLELIEAMLKLNYTERPQSVFTVQKRLIVMAQAARSQKPTLFALIKERLTREL